MKVQIGDAGVCRGFLPESGEVALLKACPVLVVSIPEGMREKIASLAEANGRSMTAEVVAALEQHRPDRLHAVEVFVENHRKLIEELEECREWLFHDVSRDIEKLQGQVADIDQLVRPGRYDDMK